MNVIKNVCQKFYESNSKDLDAIVEKALLPYKDKLLSLVGPSNSNQPLQLLNSSNASATEASQKKEVNLVDEVLRTSNKTEPLTAEQHSQLSQILEEILNIMYKVAESISLKWSGTSSSSMQSPKLASASPASSPSLTPLSSSPSSAPQFDEAMGDQKKKSKVQRVTMYSVFIVTSFLCCSTLLKFSRTASTVMEESVSSFLSKKQM